MNAQKKTSNPAPLAHRVPAEVSDLINTYAAWLTEQTGYTVDPMSVYLGSQLRSTFQKSDDNQKRLATAANERAARDAAKAAPKAEREAAATKKAEAVEHDRTEDDTVCTCGEKFANKGALTRHVRRSKPGLVSLPDYSKTATSTATKEA